MLAVELHEFCFEVGADAGKDGSQVVEDVLGKHLSAAFGHEDQMHMHREDAVSSVPNIVVVAHRPKYTELMRRRQAFKYELMPTGGQQRDLRRFAGSCRFVFNKALALQKQRH